MILCEWDAPEVYPGQSCVHLFARILSTSFSSVSIFSVCCYSSVSISMVLTHQLYIEGVHKVQCLQLSQSKDDIYTLYSLYYAGIELALLSSCIYMVPDTWGLGRIVKVVLGHFIVGTFSLGDMLTRRSACTFSSLLFSILNLKSKLQLNLHRISSGSQSPLI